MLDILSTLPGRKKHTQSGWYSFNAPCCHNRGHNADKRYRGGLLFTEDKNWIYNCFNCRFRCGFVLGRPITSNTKKLLLWCGLDSLSIERLNLESLRYRDLLDVSDTVVRSVEVKFEHKSLPDTAVLVDPNNPEHRIHTDYLASRGFSITDYSFYCDPSASRTGIILPYYHNGTLVGHTCRYYDDRKPKYVAERQSGYVFNLDAQQPHWSVCLLTEGEFDALSIGGCAYMGNNISDVQVAQLAALRRTIIVVPDQDRTGLEICESALQHGYKVSIPQWDAGIKDVNAAVVKYGRLQTLLSILRAASSSKIKVELARKRYK